MRIESVGSPTLPRAATQDVDARRTPVSMSEVRSALAHAVQSVTGRPAGQRTLDVLSAQVSLETAHGGSMFNFNFGGIKGASPTGGTAHYMTREVQNGQEVKLQQGFRAYHSLEEGAHDYVSVLQSRFPNALGSAMVGDIGGFAHSLRQAHYYTASESDYTAGLRAAAGMSALPGHALLPSSGAPVSGSESAEFSTSAELSRVLEAVAASSARIAAPDPKT